MGAVRERNLVAAVILHSILVTTAGRPRPGAFHVLRHAEHFLVATVVSSTDGPPSSMPSWAVTWEAEEAETPQSLDMARNGFAFDARSTPAEALEWHAIDEAHWIEHGYAPNHWK
jgi:hypothetical protein